MRFVSSTESFERSRHTRRSIHTRLPGSDFIVSILLMLAFLAMIALGYGAFRRPGSMADGSPMNVDRAIFMSINAATLTGFPMTIPIETYNPPAQAMVLVLTISGSLASLMIGGLAVARLLEMHYSIKRVLMAALIAETVAVGLGTAMTASADRSMLASATLAASAFGNSGLVIGSAGAIDHWLTHLLLPLALLGGLGLPVLIELYDWMANRREISFYSRSVLVLSAALYVLGAAAIIAVNRPEKRSEKPATELTERLTAQTVWKARVLRGAVASANARTAGLPFEYAGAWPRAMQWVVIVLMFIGASPASTGGGLKTTTLYELGRGARVALDGRAPGRIMGVAIAWTLLYTAMIVVTMTLLLRTQAALPGDRALFLTVSAAANVGLTPDPISITGEGLYTLCGAMFFGRFVPWIILWWSALTTQEADIAVG